MLTTSRLEQILARLPALTVGVVGDLFLDRYFDLDADLTEPSIETGLDAYQVVRVRSQPGAAGTVLNNLVALGVGHVLPVAVVGDDGEGYELLAALHERGIPTTWVLQEKSRRTPTYMKPMFQEAGRPARELNRLDIKNRRPLPPDGERALLQALDEIWPKLDALVVLDQVSEPDCGVITARLREHLAELAADCPDRPVLADSRERIGLFLNVWLKPNRQECQKAVGGAGPPSLVVAVQLLAEQTGRPVFCTVGEQGILLADGRAPGVPALVPAYLVTGPIDVVGAGDSTSAAIVCAVAAGASLAEAASFGNLVASVTIQQLGTTGTASPAQVRGRWQEVQG
jgi:rfaE bifunctional protein kinase chain/domain